MSDPGPVDPPSADTLLSEVRVLQTEINDKLEALQKVGVVCESVAGGPTQSKPARVHLNFTFRTMP